MALTFEICPYIFNSVYCHEILHEGHIRNTHIGDSNTTNEVLISLWWFLSPAYGITTILLVNGYNAQVYGITTNVLNESNKHVPDNLSW